MCLFLHILADPRIEAFEGEEVGIFFSEGGVFGHWAGLVLQSFLGGLCRDQTCCLVPEGAHIHLPPDAWLGLGGPK